MTIDEMIEALQCYTSPSRATCKNYPYNEKDSSCVRKLVTSVAAMLGNNLNENKLEKTADEMLRELGYALSFKNKNEIIYEKPLTGKCDLPEDKVKLIVSVISKRIGFIICTKENISVDYVNPTFDEIRAICKLLDEMGVDLSKKETRCFPLDAVT